MKLNPNKERTHMKATKNLLPNIKEQIMNNLARIHGAKLNGYTEAQILDAYDNWSTSEDYPDESKMPEWLGVE